MSRFHKWPYMSQQPDDHTMPTTENRMGESASDADHSQELPVDEVQKKSAENGGAIQAELQMLQDKYLRLAAEFENYKRRAQRDQNDSIRFGNESLLKNLLPIIDNLERAIQFAKDADTSGALLEGVELTHKQFLETVGKLGVRQISSQGNTFDPAIHQAVAQVESENAEPNTVVEEFQKGYFLHDRILRPAMVSVAKAKSDLTESSSSGEESDEEGGIEA
jgi:molecular chaperone GrpE